MIDENLIKTLLLEKPKIKEYIKREVEQIDIDKIYTIIGPRRAGKTYFLFQIMDDLKAKGILEKQILYLNFEDERLANIETKDFQKILDIFYTIFPENKNKKVFFMFDEIQNTPNWTKFIRRLYDKEDCKIYITGSSAKLLSKEIATELRGRTWVYEILPFSFKEYLDLKGVTPKPTDLFNKKRFDIINHFEDFLYQGGFPEVCDLDQNKRCMVLQNYHDTVMFRDVIERYNLTNIDIVKDTFKLLINNFSRPFSVNNFYNTLKSMNKNVSKDYLYTLLSQLEDTMYFFFVPIHSNSVKVRKVNPKKIYVVDNGLINCLLFKTTKEEGWFYENLTAIELLRRGYQLTYYKGKNECDFIATNRIKNEIMAVQVTTEPESQREIDGLVEALEELKLTKGIIITKDTDKETNYKNKKIEFVSLWRWLLKKS